MADRRPNTSEILPFDEYDKLIVCFSGGKDSLAGLLDLLERGVPKSKIELWHHCIDGAPGSDSFMDWPVTESYCKAVADALGIKIRFSWREGGFYREMMRKDSLTAPVRFELPDDSYSEPFGGTRGKHATRRQFPQVSGDLSVRWCSAYLKIDVARRMLSNDPSIKTGKYLMITGERREESAGRSRYAEIERHPSTNKNRRVDQWRSVIDWTEDQVWAIMKRWNVRPHPAYELGWGRTSCMTCIFGDKHQWASVRVVAPKAFKKIADLEVKFGKTIQRKESVIDQANKGTSFVPAGTGYLGMTMIYSERVILRNGEWKLPPGAGKAGCGGPI